MSIGSIPHLLPRLYNFFTQANFASSSVSFALDGHKSKVIPRYRPKREALESQGKGAAREIRFSPFDCK